MRDEANDHFNVASYVLVGLLDSPACLNEVVNLTWQWTLEMGLDSDSDCVEIDVQVLTMTRVLRHCARMMCVMSVKRVELEQRCKACTLTHKTVQVFACL